MKIFFLYILIFVLAFFLSCSQPALKNDNEQNNDSFVDEEIENTKELDLILNQYSLSYLQDISRCIELPAEINPKEIILQFYNYLLTGNVESMLELLSDDISWTHLGPLNPALPFYNTFHGKNGFLQWLGALVTSANLNDFNVHYMMVDGNRVDSHVFEGALMLAPGTQVNIENFHTFKVNNEGKIEYVLVISESDTVVRSLGGSAGEVFETEYRTDDYQSNCQFSEKMVEKIAILAVYLIKCGKINLLNKFISNDIEVATSGNEVLVPFFGKFNGKKGIKDFSQKFSKEIKLLNIDYIVFHDNKVNIHCTIKGKSSKNNEKYQSDYVLCFQFNDKCRIAKLYSYCNTNIVADAYR